MTSLAMRTHGTRMQPQPAPVNPNGFTRSSSDKRFLSCCLAALLLLPCWAFPNKAKPLSNASAKSIRLYPENIRLSSPGTSQNFLVAVIDENGLPTDVTLACRITSNANVVTVDQSKGFLIGKSPGVAQIRVTLGNFRHQAQVTVSDRPAEMSVHFARDVISILTTKGCNGSGCHGSPAGQSGFKLSLFGYDAEADYQMIVKKNNGRRVDLQKPEQSLLLLKPSFAIPHGGGQVLSPNSEEYLTLLRWLQQGARKDSDGVRLQRLEVYPTRQILVGTGIKQRLVVIGRLSDGTTRDMTREVRYLVADDTVGTATSSGELTVSAPGLTTVTARAMGQVAAAQLGVILSRPGPDYPKTTGNNFIDDLVFSKMKQMNVIPYPLSSDREFIRRVFLDAIGVLPTPEEVQAFVADTGSDKRTRLIDALLDRTEFASHWTVKFEDWFRNCQLNSQGRSMGTFKDWIREWVAEDRPYDEVVRELLTSQGDSILTPAVNFWHPATDFMLKKFSINKAVPTISRLFLGVRLECAECHNHPLENLTQNDFYGLAAFLGRLEVKHGYGEYRRTWFLADTGEVEHPITKMPVAMKFLSGDTPQVSDGTDRRTVLADWIVSAKNPYFARATVNRIWHEYFGIGIVEPFDDFRSTNMPTNSDLLDHLAEHFVASGFRFKELHKVILNSRAYQLSSKDPSRKTEPILVERLLFVRYAPRKLPAEVLLDSISQVTGIAHSFRGYPLGTSAKDIYVPDGPDYFLVAFGLPRRDVLADRVKSPTLSQALHLMNGEPVNEKVQAEDNILGRLLARGSADAEVVQQIFERAYARAPSAREAQMILDHLASEQAAGRDQRRALDSVLWSVLNSKEFQLNH
jgi:Protein of unknown function (DUF1553)/Protein of unknown function (DUF1549)